ncbi:MAG: LuxR C-terminal-related transcriptional regulator [Ilumatobacter sp.]
MSTRSHRWEFTGRSGEVDRALDALAAGRHVAVVGHRGAGRTRFADHVGDLAEFSRRLDITASTALSSIPLGAFGAITDPAGAEVPRKIENDAIHVAVQAILRRCRDDRILIVVDDANLLDPLSIEVIHAVCASRRADITWMITIDADQTAQHRLGDLWTSDLFDVVELDDIDPAGLLRLVTEGAGLDCTMRAARQLHSFTGGRLALAHEVAAVTAGSWTRTALIESCDSLRVRSAVDRLLRTDEPEAQLLLDLLACEPDLHWDLVYPAWNESVIAGLERSGAVSNTSNGLRLTIEACGHSLVTAVSARRRRALIRRIIDVQRDPAGLPPTALVQLVLLDVSADTLLHPSISPVAVRRALDLGELSAARTIFESLPARWTSDISLLDGLLAELDAAEGRPGSASDRLAALFADDQIATQLVAARSAIDIMRRGHEDESFDRILAMGDAALDRRTRARLDLQRARRAWNSGDVARTAEFLVGVAADDIERGERIIAADLRSGVAVQRLRCHDVANLAAGAALERRTLALFFDQPFAQPEPEADNLLVTHALATALTGDVDTAAALAKQLLESELHHDVPTSVLLETLAGPAVPVGDLGGLWGPWIALINAWHRAGESNDAAALVELADRHATLGLTATELVARHFAAIGFDAPLSLAGSPPSQSTVGRVIFAHARARQDGNAEELTHVATQFRHLGWHHSATHIFHEGANMLADSDQPEAALVALLSSRHDAGRVTPRLRPRAGSTRLLTRREDDIVTAVIAGATSKTIAEVDEVSVRTVDNQIYRLCHRLGVAGRRDLIALAATASASASASGSALTSAVDETG